MQNNKFRRRRQLAAVAIPVVIGLGAAVIPAHAQLGSSGSSAGSSLLSPLTDYLKNDNIQGQTPTKVEHPQVSGLADGVSIDRVEWLGDRRVAVYIRSKVMPEQPVQVQILLARDWYSNPSATFPEVWALDGQRASETESGWTLYTNIQQFFADKNVNVILPVGGESSFYSDWQKPNNGKNYKWESFLTGELPSVLQRMYRSNGQRAILGLSMGGTGAMNIAEHHPEMFNFAGSFSGYLDTTSTMMPTLISGALQEVGGYDATAMWGPKGTQGWTDHDPKTNIEALRGKTIYVSAGNGSDDFGKLGSVATEPSNAAGVGLEVAARMTTETFVNRANQLGIPVISVFRPSGVHNWPYWQFELTQAWPHIADALALGDADRGANCNPIGQISELTASMAWGSCVNNEYDVPGGKAQDFVGGRAYWSAATGAHMLVGRIGARYVEMGATSSWLGFPTSNELDAPDGKGKFVTFEHGTIYWSPTTGAWAIPADMVDAYGRAGYEAGALGYPTGESTMVNGALQQQFEGGYVIRTGEPARTFFVRGKIAQHYTEIGAAASVLGAPTGDEILIPGGAFQEFTGGAMYWSEATGAHYVLNGPIRDRWGQNGWEAGFFGWPINDESEIPAGGKIVMFQHGSISQVNGVVVEQRN